MGLLPIDAKYARLGGVLGRPGILRVLNVPTPATVALGVLALTGVPAPAGGVF